MNQREVLMTGAAVIPFNGGGKGNGRSRDVPAGDDGGGGRRRGGGSGGGGRRRDPYDERIFALKACLEYKGGASTRAEIARRMTRALRREVTIAEVDVLIGMVRDDPAYWGFFIKGVKRGYPRKGMEDRRWKAHPTEKDEVDASPHWDDETKADAQNGMASWMQSTHTSLHRNSLVFKYSVEFWEDRAIKRSLRTMARRSEGMIAEGEDILDMIRDLRPNGG